MNLPTKTQYEIRSLKLILAGEGSYSTILSRDFIGDSDEVGFWNRILIASEITQL